MADWRPIDTAPDADFFLVWDVDDKEVVMAFRNGRGSDDILTRSDCIQINASHWMPLPGAPNG